MAQVPHRTTWKHSMSNGLPLLGGRNRWALSLSHQWGRGIEATHLARHVGFCRPVFGETESRWFHVVAWRAASLGQRGRHGAYGRRARGCDLPPARVRGVPPPHPIPSRPSRPPLRLDLRPPCPHALPGQVQLELSERGRHRQKGLPHRASGSDAHDKTYFLMTMLGPALKCVGSGETGRSEILRVAGL